MNIYIPIEVKARELEGRLLLALAVAERFPFEPGLDSMSS